MKENTLQSDITICKLDAIDILEDLTFLYDWGDQDHRVPRKLRNCKQYFENCNVLCLYITKLLKYFNR